MSLVVIKAEVVRRLVHTDPDQAALQAADIETVGRQALTEIREAVTGYRPRDLDAELTHARSALADAGIEMSISESAEELPEAARSLLGWCVREAVTNVIRHSHARKCTISLRVRDGIAELQVRDDGAGGAVGSAGTGLRGLAERLSAAGGRVDAGPVPDGFTLTATHTGATVIRLLLAEDQQMMRGALALLLNLEPDLEVVAQVSSGDEVLAAARTSRPDVALLDIEMPGRTGIDATADLLAELPECRVLILTTFGRPGYLRRAMEAGASGFLVKDAPVENLATAIRRVVAGERVVDADLAASALSAGANPLSGREQDVLRAGVDGSTITDIAVALRLSESTVRNYLSAAIGKTGTRNRTEAARVAQQNGWL